jgi:hypothetical protein
VVVNHAKLEVPTLTHTHAPTRFSQFPFLKVVPFNIFQPIFSHLSAIHSFWKQTSGMVRALCASQCGSPPLEVLVLCLAPVRIGPWRRLGPGWGLRLRRNSNYMGVSQTFGSSTWFTWYFQTYLLPTEETTKEPDFLTLDPEVWAPP